MGRRKPTSMGSVCLIAIVVTLWLVLILASVIS